MELLRKNLCLLIMLLAFTQFTDARSSHAVRRSADNADDDYSENQMFQDDVAEELMNDEDDVDQDDDHDDSPPPQLLTKSQNFSVKRNSTLSLPCVVTNSQDAVIMWYKGDKLLFLGETNAVPSKYKRLNGSFVIPDAQPSDSSDYTCKLVGGNNEQWNVTHKVLVRYPPTHATMTPEGDGRYVMEGSDLVVTCKADGVPAPTLQWSVEHHGETHRLGPQSAEYEPNGFRIRNVTRDKSGSYICLADNRMGEYAVSAVNIKVLGKPHVHIHRPVVNAAPGVTAVLFCSVHEEPESNIRWLKDGRHLENSQNLFISIQGQNSNLTVNSVTEEDFGTYTCEATNKYGVHSRAVDLVKEPVADTLEGDGPAISWKIHSQAPLLFVEIEYRNVNQSGDWEKVNPDIPPSSDHHYEVRHELKNLAPGVYEAHARARNEYGWSSLSNIYSFNPVRDNLDEEVGSPVNGQPQKIQVASVMGSTSGANFMPVSATISSTAFMCLLIRLL